MGCREGAGFPLLAQGTVPQGGLATKSLNNSPNVNNLKIFPFNCFPCPAWGRLCWPLWGRERGRGRQGAAVNHGARRPASESAANSCDRGLEGGGAGPAGIDAGGRAG